MTEPAVNQAHPPEKLMRAVNPVLHFLLRTPVVGGALGDFMVLNFTGRKSGRAFSVPVSAHRIDGDLYALANAGWIANFSGGRDVRVLTGGRTTAMRGELIRDPATVAELAHRAAQAYGARKAQRTMGLKFSGAGVPTVAEFAEAATREGLAAVKLTPA